MTSDKARDEQPRRPRFSPTARANLAAVVVETDKQAGRDTPKWIRDLAATRRR